MNNLLFRIKNKSVKLVILCFGLALLFNIAYDIGSLIAFSFSPGIFIQFIVMLIMFSLAAIGLILDFKEMVILPTVALSSYWMLTSLFDGFSCLTSLSSEGVSGISKISCVISFFVGLLIIGLGTLVCLEYIKHKNCYLKLETYLFLGIEVLELAILILNIVNVARGTSFWFTILDEPETIMTLAGLFICYLTMRKDLIEEDDKPKSPKREKSDNVVDVTPTNKSESN